MTSGLILPVGGRSAMPRPPAEIADEVELYARESGRTASLHFVPTRIENFRVASGTWIARFSLKPNDKRMLLWRQGKTDRPPTEDVWFHRGPTREEIERGTYNRNDVIPLDILQMGASGVREFLERGNTWSGRGQYRSLVEQASKVLAQDRDEAEKVRVQAKEESRYEQRDKRRWRYGIPVVRGADLKE